MKRRFCTIVMVALLVLPVASLGATQEDPPPAPQGWRAPPEDRSVAPPKDRDLEGWEPPPPPTGPGAVISVTTTDDELNSDGDCSLREAIQAANTNAAVDACTPGMGADTVLVPAGTYLLTIPGAGENGNQTGDLDILDHVTLTGDGAGLTILDGNNLDRVLHMWTGLTVEINALTVTHGRVVDVQGGGILNQGTLTLNDVSLLENQVVSSGGQGGGGLANVALSYDSSATLSDCLVDANEARAAGGILSASGTGRTSELTLNDSTVSNNTASWVAGGLYAGFFTGAQNAASNMVVLNSIVEGNTSSTAEAGGIEAVGRAASNVITSLTVDHSTVAGNTSSTAEGGGIAAVTTAGDTLAVTVTVAHSTIEGNTAGAYGGGIDAGSYGLGNLGVSLTVDHSTIRYNAVSSTSSFSGNGGGIDAYRAAVTIVDSAIHDNTASCENLIYCGDGGGLFLQESLTVVEASTIRNNTASGTGAGPAIGGGGGLALVDGTATIRNSTVSGNQASHNGGGVAVSGETSYATLMLENTTVAGNDASVAGGGIVNENAGAGARTVFKNSLVGGNSAAANGSCSNPDLGFGPGILDSLGNNLEDHDLCEFHQPTDLPNTDPILGPLQDNGGPTWTHALLVGSPAIDAGDDDAAPPTDQRGVPRPQGPASDIGSFEVEANITVNTCDDELNSDGDCSLREAIEAANTDTAVDACLAGSGHHYLTLPACTYTLAIPGANEDANQTGDLDILDDLTIYGAGADTTVIDPVELDRVVQIHPGHTAEINDLTVTGGLVVDDNGGAIENRGTLTLNHATVRGNTVQTSGYEWGGALTNAAAVQDATAYVNHCLIAENIAPCCAGLQNAAMDGFTAELHVDHTSVMSNTATMWGAGIDNGFLHYTGGNSILTVTDSLVAANAALGMTAYAGGGGIGSSGYEPANCHAWLTLERTTVCANTATNDPSLQGAKGAGVMIPGTTATVVDSTISDNVGTGVGDVQPALGGGMAIWDSTVTLSNTTVSGNQVLGQAGGSGAGGGIALATNDAPASLTLLNVTFAGNSADQVGGAITSAKVSNFTPVVTFKNTLIAGNTAPDGASCFGPDFGFGPPEFTSLGHNLEDYDLCEFDQPSDLPNTDGLLGALQDNGGPTWTHALLEGSLARDHGDDDACPPSDQRGVPRPQGPHCDISAFEAYPDENAPSVVAISPPDGATDVALDAPLVITFSEPISVPTFVYSVSPDPGSWLESWGPNDTMVSLTHDLFAYGTVYSATVTAAEDRAGNPMTAPHAWSFTTVAEPCHPVETVAVEGPASLLVGETGVYSATYAPITATLPVTLTWQDDTVGATAVYSWTLPGSYTLTVTATNPCGEIYGVFPVTVGRKLYRIYLPLVVRDSDNTRGRRAPLRDRGAGKPNRRGRTQAPGPTSSPFRP
jgi:CSLREA domain-containing protein